MNKIKHRHHLVPRHRGGTDADGLVTCSPTQHAMFHYCEWKLHGHREDYIAWKGLAGFYGKEDIIHEIRVMTSSKTGKMIRDTRPNQFSEMGKIGGKKGKGRPKKRPNHKSHWKMTEQDVREVRMKKKQFELENGTGKRNGEVDKFIEKCYYPYRDKLTSKSFYNLYYGSTWKHISV
jgi:hypothetical protein